MWRTQKVTNVFDHQKGSIHVYPPDEWRVHALHEKCSCCPKIVPETDKRFGQVIHNSWDDREGGEKLDRILKKFADYLVPLL